MNPKWYTEARKWTGCMVQCLYIKVAPNQIIRLIFLGEMVQNNQKTSFYAVFGYSGAIWALKKINKGPQVGGMFGPMSELKNNPLTKSFGPFF
jgi:hypothetical protein